MRIAMNCAPGTPVYDYQSLVQAKPWHRTVDKTLPEPLIAQNIDAYMRQQPSMSYTKYASVYHFTFASRLMDPRFFSTVDTNNNHLCVYFITVNDKAPDTSFKILMC